MSLTMLRFQGVNCKPAGYWVITPDCIKIYCLLSGMKLHKSIRNELPGLGALEGRRVPWIQWAMCMKSMTQQQ